MVAACRRLSVGQILAWRTGRGRLTFGGELGFPTRFFPPHHAAILAELLAVAGELGRSPEHVASRWVLEQAQVIRAIVGARTTDQFGGTLAASWRLPEASLKRLERASAVPRRFPRAMEQAMAEPRKQAMRMPRRLLNALAVVLRATSSNRRRGFIPQLTGGIDRSCR